MPTTTRSFDKGLKSLLATYDRFEVVAEVARSSDLEAIVSTTPCEVVVLDLQMDQWVMGEIEWLSRRATVVVLTASESADDAKAALRLGARAVVQKRFALETLIGAIQAAVDGFVSSPPTYQAECHGTFGQADSQSPHRARISDRSDTSRPGFTTRRSPNCYQSLREP